MFGNHCCIVYLDAILPLPSLVQLLVIQGHAKTFYTLYTLMARIWLLGIIIKKICETSRAGKLICDQNYKSFCVHASSFISDSLFHSEVILPFLLKTDCSLFIKFLIDWQITTDVINTEKFSFQPMKGNNSPGSQVFTWVLNITPFSIFWS